MKTNTHARLWVKTYLDHWAELALNQEFDLHMRVHFLALSKAATPNNHVHFEPGEIRQSLEVVNKRTGETGPPDRDKVSKAVNRAVALGLLAPGSNARCLVLPTGVEYGIGDPTKVCDRHGGCLAKATSERKVALGRQQGCLAKATPDALTCDDAPSLLDVSHRGVEVEAESVGVKDEEAPEGASQSGTHRQRIKRISEVSGVEEIILTGEGDEGDGVPHLGEELTGEEDEGLSAQSDLPADVANWDDLLPTPSADASVPSAPPVAPLPTEPRQPCHLVPTADEEAVEVDEAPEEPIGVVVGSRYGGGRRLVTLPPLADEPQRHRPRWGRSS